MDFRNMTYEELLKEKLGKVTTNVDKREGSIIYDAMAPNSWESYMLLQVINTYYKESFGSTASRPYLIERCKERGITPKPASFGVYRGVFNKEVPLGTRFSLELVNYEVIKKIKDYEYELKSEALGVLPNGNFGKLIPIDYVEGLTEMELVETLVLGEDEEETESLRERYLNSFDIQAYGGNIKDYIEKVISIGGVGAVKVKPVWNGGGTVKLTILDSDLNVASESLISKVKGIIDPEFEEGLGVGVAPIGHIVTVNTATNKAITLNFRIVLKNISIGLIKKNIEEVIKDYLKELTQEWNEGSLELRVSKIEHAILSISDDIVDILETKINGQNKNYILKEEEIPELEGIYYEVI